MNDDNSVKNLIMFSIEKKEHDDWAAANLELNVDMDKYAEMMCLKIGVIELLIRLDKDLGDDFILGIFEKILNNKKAQQRLMLKNFQKKRQYKC